jgi:hypothetical protein
MMGSGVRIPLAAPDKLLIVQAYWTSALSRYIEFRRGEAPGKPTVLSCAEHKAPPLCLGVWPRIDLPIRTGIPGAFISTSLD